MQHFKNVFSWLKILVFRSKIHCFDLPDGVQRRAAEDHVVKNAKALKVSLGEGVDGMRRMKLDPGNLEWMTRKISSIQPHTPPKWDFKNIC